MDEVKKSKSGLDYVTVTLSEGPRSKATAVLMAIAHSEGRRGVVMKLQREKKSIISAMGDESPGSFSVREEEMGVLLKFLQEQVGLVLSGSGRYLKVGDDAIGELLKEIGDRLSEVDRDKLLDLAGRDKFLPKDVLDVAMLRARQDALEEFGELLARNAVEQEFQKWFSANGWVLGTDCARILDERSIDVENIADYLTENYDGHADIIELKRPGLAFWAQEKDRGNLIPHSDLVKAITQAQNYQFELEREMDSLKTFERTGGCPIAKPRSLLIHGRSNGWDKEHFRAQRLLNGGYSSIQILTYDQVLARAKRILGR